MLTLRLKMTQNHTCIKAFPESHNCSYQLSISGFTGITPADPFKDPELNGQPFSTYDKVTMVIVQSRDMVVKH